MSNQLPAVAQALDPVVDVEGTLVDIDEKLEDIIAAISALAETEDDGEGGEHPLVTEMRTLQTAIGNMPALRDYQAAAEAGSAAAIKRHSDQVQKALKRLSGADRALESGVQGMTTTKAAMQAAQKDFKAARQDLRGAAWSRRWSAWFFGILVGMVCGLALWPVLGWPLVYWLAETEAGCSLLRMQWYDGLCFFDPSSIR
jgi:hypothetical protein